MKLPSKKYLKARDVAEMLSVSESAIYKWASGDNFPKPYKIGPENAKRSASRWDEDEIKEYLQKRMNP